MTTIAYRDGVMAADSGGWIGDTVHPWTQKLAKGKDGSLWGASGTAAEIFAFLDAVVESGDPRDWPRPNRGADGGASFIALRAARDGTLSLWGPDGVERFPGARYFAIGSGRDVAFGALWAGASYEDAIKAAATHSTGAILPVRTIRYG